MIKTGLFFVLLVLFAGCDHRQTQQTNVEPSGVSDPKTAYRKGFYRRTVELFEKTPALASNPEMQYLRAAAYYELQRYEDSFRYYSMIDYQEFFDGTFTKNLYPFYICKYLSVIIELGKKDLLNKEQTENLINSVALVSDDSPIREQIDSNLFNVLWKTRNTDAMFRFTENLSSEGKAWLELAKHSRGIPYNLNIVLENHKELGTAYSNLVVEIAVKDVRSKQQAKALTEMCLALKSNRALDFAKVYARLANDKEYGVIIQSALLDIQGRSTDGALFLYDYLVRNPRSSKHFYRTTHAKLVTRKQFNPADEVALLARRYHNLDFYINLPDFIEYTKDADNALVWYKKNFQKLSPEGHDQILRSLIRLDLKKAELLADLGYAFNEDNPAFILKYALIKEQLGKEEDAYKAYLKLLFKDSFGYTGLVARIKEKQLRDQYRTFFNQTMNTLKKELPRYQLENRLKINKSLLLDSEMSNVVNVTQIKKDQKAFNKIVYSDLNKTPMIRALENIDREMTNYSVELENLISGHVRETLPDSNDWHDTARLFYRYRDLFIDSSMEGYLTFRLYFYIRDQFGYSYFLNYPEDIINLVFPKPKFDMIKKYSNNDEDLAYWMLSSFLAESHFRKRVFSRVGAVGFAQVMPYTAIDIKRWMNHPEFTNYDFFDNLRMGIFYHYKMYKDMDNDIILSLAAYNAGPNAVRRWIKQYDNITDPYLFIEAIPYRETRNYVRLIVYHYGMYRLIDDNKDVLYPNQSLK